MTKKGSKFDYYKSLHTLEEITIREEWKDQLAKDLYIWARDNEEALKLSQFYISMGINNRDFDRWCSGHENLKLAKEAALILIGNRREIGGLKKKLESSIVLTSMAKYDLDWRELAEWRAKLKAETEGNKAETKIIVMEQFNPPSTSKQSPEEVAKKARNGNMMVKRQK